MNDERDRIFDLPDMEPEESAAENSPAPPKPSERVSPPDPEQPKSDHSYKVEIYDWIQSIVSTIIVVMLLFFFVGRQISVEGPSMNQTLHDTDRILITQQYTAPKNGDIVIIHTAHYGDTPIVKRVIAVAGQTIDYDYATSTVYVDGVALDEPYINNPPMRSWIADFSGEMTVPEGFVFVMGDNRNESTDSRSDSVGFVDTRNIVGTVHMIVFPAKDGFGDREWDRFGLVR